MKRKIALILAAVMTITAGGQLCATAEENLLPEYSEVLQTIWDWNFDTDGVTVETKDTTASFKINGKNATNNNASITGDIGMANTGNTIDLYSTGITNKDNGTSLRIHTENPEYKVQANAMWSKITYNPSEHNYAVYEMDFATADFNIRKTAFNINSSAGWGAPFQIETNKTVSFNGISKPIEANTWYTLTQVYDFANKRIVALVDGEILGSYTFDASKSLTETLRFTIDNNTGAKTTSYVDNLKVYSMQGVSHDPTFEVTKKTTAAIPKGYKAAFTSVVKYYDNADCIEVSVSEDGREYTDTVKYPVDTESFSVEAPYETTYVKAALVDADGAVLAEHKFTVDTVIYDNLTVEKDIDFENASFNADGSTRFLLVSNGEQVKDGGEPWAVNTGSAESTAVIEDSAAVGDGVNGKALHLTTGNTTDTVQTNAFYTQYSSGWVFYELDYASDILGAAQTVITLCREDGWTATLTVNGSGKFVFNEKEIGSFETNRWYNIKYAVNLDGETVYCFIDDELVGTMTMKPLGALVRYATIIRGVAGNAWVDNIKISTAQNLPAVESVSASGNTVEIALNIATDISADMLTLSSGGNYLTPVSAEYDGNTLVVTTLEEVFTGVRLDVAFDYASVDYGTLLITGSVDVPAAEFDVKSVVFTGASPTATIVNAGDTAQEVTMVMVEKNSSGAVIGVKVSETVEVSDETKISLTASEQAAASEVFFINNFTDCLAVKNMIYMSEPKGEPKTYTEGTQGNAVLNAEYDEAAQVIKIYAANKTESGSPVTVHFTSYDTEPSDENPPCMSALYIADGSGSISEDLPLPENLPAGRYRLLVGMKGQEDGTESVDLLIYSSKSEGFNSVLDEINSASTAAQVKAVIADPEKAIEVGIDAASVQYLDDVAANIIELKSGKLTADEFIKIFAYASAVAAVQNGASADSVMQSYAKAFDTDYASYSALSDEVRGEITEVIKSSELSNGMYTAEELENIALLRLCKTSGEVQTLIEKKADGFGISLTGDYKNVSVNKRTLIYAELLDKKASVYTYAQAKSIFDAAVAALQPSSGTTGGGGGGGGSSSSSSSTSSVVKVETAVSESTGTYRDISGHFAEEAIGKMAAKGIISGYADNTFRPDNKITRAEMCRLIAAMTNMSASGTTDFADVDETAWYAEYVNILGSNGIIFGDGEYFRPNDRITRQDTAVIIARVIEKYGIVLEGGYTFNDNADISDYARESIASLAANGFLQGDGQNFYPKNEITRAEAAVVLNAVYTEYFGG